MTFQSPDDRTIPAGEIAGSFQYVEPWAKDDDDAELRIAIEVLVGSTVISLAFLAVCLDRLW